MSIYKRGRTWWIYLVQPGRPRVRKSAETGDRQAAQRIHDEVRAELWRRRPTGHTFYGALDAWEKAERRGRSDQYRVEKIKRVVPDCKLHALDAESLARAIPATSAGTFNRYAILIAAALNLARRRGWIDVTPAIERRRMPAGRIRWLTPAEWRRLRRKLPDHLRPLAEFALATGLRQHNVTHLEWSQVDLRRRVAWIHPDQAKARKAIGVPLNDAAHAVLRAQKGLHERWVFPWRRRPIGKIKTAWRRALKAAKIEDFTWHDLRHTWASWHVQSGTPLAALRELGGWASMQMVMRYGHLAPEHLRRYAGNVSGRVSRQSR